MTTSQASVEKQLPVADHLEILNLYARYNHTVDAVKLDAWTQCFVEGGALDVPSAGVVYEGTEQLIEFGKRYMSRNPGLERHITTNIEVYGEGDEAHGRAYLVMCVGGAGKTPPNFHMSSRYEDTLRKTEDGWRFVRRILSFDGS